MIANSGLVSVMMPAYNAAGYIGHAIESLLAQSYTNWELLVVNDGSTDTTPEIVRSFSDARISLTNKENGGESTARNLALERSKGEFIAYLDADDLYLPNHLAATVGFLRANPHRDAVYTDGLHIDENGRRLVSLQSRRRGPFEGRLFEHAALASDIFGPPLCVVLRHETLARLGLRYDPRIVIGPDWEFFIRYTDYAQFGYLAEHTCLYRVHQTNITTRVDPTKRLASLALCREKTIKQAAFGACSVETRAAVFYDLAINLLRHQPEQQAAMTGWQEFRDLPADEQGRLLRLMASEAILHGVDHEHLGGWLRRAGEVNRGDRRSRLLMRLYTLSPRLAQAALWMRSPRRMNHDAAPFADLADLHPPGRHHAPDVDWIDEMLSVLSIFGTRPEAIKMAPVVQQLERRRDRIRSVICVTAQHRQMLDQVVAVFGMKPDFDLDIMRPDQSLSQVTAAVIQKLDPVVQEVKPDWILVQGDTTTVMAASLVGFYHRVRVGHVEAGLRTFDKHRPFPEEVNRRITDVTADLCFAPTSWARQNLLKEGVPETRIRVTGNTVIDALLQVQAREYSWDDGPLAGLPRDKRLILITAHRRESFGEKFRDLCLAIKELAGRYLNDCHFVYPVHPNPNVRGPVETILGGEKNISLIAPLDYVPLVHLMKRSTLILTDSGGIQEEAPSLGVPVLVLRDRTERPEGIEAGTARLVGTERYRIVEEARLLLDSAEEHARMSRAVSPYGDGKAAERIVEALLEAPTTVAADLLTSANELCR